MGFRVGAYACVWKVEPRNDKVTSVQLLISKKNRNTGEYEQDFSGFVSFVGTANAAAAAKLHQKDKIKLGDVDVTTSYNAEKKVNYTNYACFGFEMADAGNKGGGESPSQTAVQKTVDAVDSGEVLSDGELPF